MKQCKVPECGRKCMARGFCKPHYWAYRRGEDPYTYQPEPRYKTPEDRIKNNTRQNGDCIQWVGALSTEGYGVMTNPAPGGGMVYVHRYVYEQVNGELIKDLIVDHICHNRNCVNINHLRAATRQQNNSNKKGADSRSLTGRRNVSYVKRCGRYRVMVMKDGRQYHGGYFSSEGDAVAAAEKLREELFGEFAGRG